MGPDNWCDWFWDVALDGVVGALIGALIGALLAAYVAFRVARATIQHEQKQAAAQAVEQARVLEQSRRETARQAEEDRRADARQVELMRLVEAAWTLQEQVTSKDPTYPTTWWRWNLEVDVLIAGMSKDEPTFAILMSAVRDRMSKVGSGRVTPRNGLQLDNAQGTVAAISNAHRLLRRRLVQPEYFDMDEATRDSLVEAIERDGFV